MTTLKNYQAILNPPAPPPPPAKVDAGVSEDSGSEDEAEVPTTKIEHEDLTEIKNWFNSDVYRTSQFVPSQAKSKTVPAKKFGEYSVVTRRILEDDKRTVRSVVLEIQSERLRTAFRNMVEHPGAVDLDANPIAIPRPYHLLFWEREKIRRFKHDSDELRKEMQLIANFIRTDIDSRAVRREYKHLVPRGKISYKIIWTIFQPGQLVFFNQNGVVECCRLIELGSRGPAMEVVGLGVDYDGTRLGETKKKVTMMPFDGIRDIDTLPAVPLKYWKDGEGLREKLIARGKKWEHLFKAPRHRVFRGLCWNPFGPDFQVNERVVLDYDTFMNENECARPSLLPKPAKKSVELPADPPIAADADLSDDEDDSASNSGSEPIVISASDITTDDEKLVVEPEECEQELTDDQYLRCPARLPGFCLRTKRWGSFLIEEPFLTEIQWKGDAFKMLQMEKYKKDLVKSLIDGHRDEVRTFDDIVEGKGRGLVFLLHGPPGLGKTLTAESISEHTKRPLYSISSGELTTEVKQMEKEITRIFKVGNKWGAVVLLDEADVLMSKRSPGVLEQNAIVSIFLRLMEYYEGILFLTTNRHDDFDDAIYNRIHITLAFEAITPEVRRTIWRNILDSNANAIDIDGECWTEQVFAALGEFEVNGRSIKNLLRTAACFAQSEKKPLAVKHLHAVMMVNLLADENKRKKFERALEGLGHVISQCRVIS